MNYKNNYNKKAEILTQNFFIAGHGCFDLNLEEIAHIIELIETQKHPADLKVNLQELYDRLAKTRLG